MGSDNRMVREEITDAATRRRPLAMRSHAERHLSRLAPGAGKRLPYCWRLHLHLTPPQPMSRVPGRLVSASGNHVGSQLAFPLPTVTSSHCPTMPSKRFRRPERNTTPPENCPATDSHPPRPLPCIREWAEPGSRDAALRTLPCRDHDPRRIASALPAAPAKTAWAKAHPTICAGPVRSAGGHRPHSRVSA
jgi:hypothetical protein